MSECDLLSGVVLLTGANTVSLLTQRRESSPPAECGTYATHSLWLWNVCARMHAVHGASDLRVVTFGC